MGTYRELLALAARSSEEEFLARLHDPVFIGGETTSGNDDWDFHTHVVDAFEEEPSAANPAYCVPICCKQGNERITIGRTEATDLHFEHPSISKLHAFVHCSQDTISLEDAGSSNGTFANGERLAQNERAALKNGDRIRLGSLQLLYLDPEGLYAMLSALGDD